MRFVLWGKHEQGEPLSLTSSPVTMCTRQTPDCTCVSVCFALRVLLLADIQPGRGLYYMALQDTWQAVNCDINSYGMTNITYGLTPAPCRDCPANMVANDSDAYPASKRFFRRNADGTGGFIDPEACVTLPGGCGVPACQAVCVQASLTPAL